MKHTLSILAFITSINFAHAQFDENNAIYSTLEVNLGNYVGLDFGLNYVYKEKYSFKIGYTGNIRTPKTRPEDYTYGLAGFLFLGSTWPFDQFANYQIGFGKIYSFNKTGTIRANLSFGLGYTSIKEPENWEMADSGIFFDNYNWDYRGYRTLSIIINPKIEFPLTRRYGLTISPMVQISKDRTYFGVGFGEMSGLLRKKNKPKPSN